MFIKIVVAIAIGGFLVFECYQLIRDMVEKHKLKKKNKEDNVSE